MKGDAKKRAKRNRETFFRKSAKGESLVKIVGPIKDDLKKEVERDLLNLV